ncbi:restriction endonuclease subunit S [Pseudarthrobacter sp. H2]|uniref:restriction endonuclease subunit S n=1 Tax=Pseudarthrobacter sp. H2 TaxID=3418415 RepID=UPI003CEF0AF0
MSNLPEGWERKRIDELCRVTRGASPRPIHEWVAPAGTPWIKIADATADPSKYITKTKEFIRNEGRTKSVVVYPGDLILSNSATPGIPKFLGIEACIHDGWLLLRELRDIDPMYLYYVFLNDRKDLAGQGNGSIFTNLKTDIVKSHKLMVPPIWEQQAIAEVLGALDDKIAANTKLSETAISLLEAHFAALGLNRDPAEDAAVVGLDELVTLNPKYAAPSETEPIYVDMQKLPVSNLSISDWDHRPAKGGARFMNGDTLLARITPCLENRKTGFVDFLKESQIGIGSTEFIVLRSRPGVPVALSYFLATSERFRTFAIRHMVGTSGRQRVSALDLTGYTLGRPVESALTSFGEASKSTFPFVKSLTDENRTLATTRDALLPQLMSGKLRVKDAEALVAAAV